MILKEPLETVWKNLILKHKGRGKGVIGEMLLGRLSHSSKYCGLLDWTSWLASLERSRIFVTQDFLRNDKELDNEKSWSLSLFTAGDTYNMPSILTVQFLISFSFDKSYFVLFEITSVNESTLRFLNFYLLDWESTIFIY